MVSFWAGSCAAAPGELGNFSESTGFGEARKGLSQLGQPVPGEDTPYSFSCVWFSLVLIPVTAAANVAILNLLALLVLFSLDRCSEMVFLPSLLDLSVEF